MVLTLAFYCFVHVSSTAVLTRNLWQFTRMINYKGYSWTDYNGYGCWCGTGSYGALTIDDTDNCCRIHDQCYDQISGGLFGCSPKIVSYDWEELSNKAIACTDSIDTCDRNACECDKAAADCYQKHRSTYDSDFLNMGSSTKMSVICNP